MFSNIIFPYLVLIISFYLLLHYMLEKKDKVKFIQFEICTSTTKKCFYMWLDKLGLTKTMKKSHVEIDLSHVSKCVCIF